MSEFSFRQQNLGFLEHCSETLVSYTNLSALPAESSYIDDYVTGEPWFSYTYDLGDNWDHKVTVEQILPDYDKACPVVLKYKGDCPPESGEEEALPYDIEAVNAYLAQTCTAIPDKIEKRTSLEIYRDWEKGQYGLYMKRPKGNTRKGVPQAKRDLEAWLNTMAKNLEQRIDELSKDNLAKKSLDPTLEETLQYFDKASLRDIAKDKQILYKSKDTKAALVKKIYAVMSRPEIMESYFITMTDEETKNLKEAMKSRSAALDMTDEDFPILNGRAYITYDKNYGLDIPIEVQEAFRKLNKGELHKKRLRRTWLMQCLNVVNMLYGIAPMAILVKLFNQHKKYKTTVPDLVEEMESIPPDLLDGEIHEETYYADGLWPDDLDLLENQGDVPFYIPPTQEILELWDDPLASLPYLQELMHFFLDHFPDLADEELYQLLTGLHVLMIHDAPIQPIVEQLMNGGFNLTEEEELFTLPNLLKKISYNTRKLFKRGFKPIELDPQKNKSQRSNLIEVKNWRIRK